MLPVSLIILQPPHTDTAHAVWQQCRTEVQHAFACQGYCSAHESILQGYTCISSQHGILESRHKHAGILLPHTWLLTKCSGGISCTMQTRTGCFPDDCLLPVQLLPKVELGLGPWIGLVSRLGRLCLSPQGPLLTAGCQSFSKHDQCGARHMHPGSAMGLDCRR